MQIVFVPCLYTNLKAIEILNLCCRPFPLSSFKSFLKKEVWNWSPCLIFDMIFEQEYFSCYILLTNAFISLDIGQYVYCNCLLNSLWRNNFWKWPYLSNQAVFSTGSKCQGKKRVLLVKMVLIFFNWLLR